MHAQSLQLCLTLCNPMDCSPLGSSVHGILQARLLGWVAMPSSRGSSAPRHWTHVSYVSYVVRWVLYLWCHLGSPSIMGTLVQPPPQKLIHIAVGSMPSLCNRFGMITCNINFEEKDNLEIFYEDMKADLSVLSQLSALLGYRYYYLSATWLLI